MTHKFILKEKQFHRRKNDGQMIILLGVTLAISVFLISAIPSQISSLNPTVPQARSSALLTEFIHIRDAYGLALNYNFVRLTLNPPAGVGFGSGSKSNDPNITYYGKDGKYTFRYDLSEVMTQTTNAFNTIELHYDRMFSASVIYSSFSHFTAQGTIYNLGITLSLQDDYEIIKETVGYQILINEFVH